MTVDLFKIGGTIRFGRYSVKPDGQPKRIEWYKAEKDNQFIAKHCIDCLAFDAPEYNSANHYFSVKMPNSSYIQSNINQFLNSEDYDWFRPTHEKDEPPNTEFVGYHNRYDDHTGFLSEFEDYEVESLVVENVRGTDGDCCEAKVWLPSANDVTKDGFSLFRRKGIRGTPTKDLFLGKENMFGYSPSSYVPYFTRNSSGNMGVLVMGRDGKLKTELASSAMGIRPVIKLKSNLELEIEEDGIYHIKPYETVRRQDITGSSFDNIMKFLCMA